MTVFLIIAAIFLVILGLVGSIVPGIAGPPFSFLGLVVLAFVEGVHHSVTFWIVMGVIGLMVFLLDYLAPIWGTKKLGGTKAGVRGSMVGMVLGLLLTLFFPVSFIVMLLGPFIGAYIGEKNAGTDDSKALKSAFGSFVGFLLSMGLKVIYASVCIFYIIWDLVKLI